MSPSQLETLSQELLCHILCYCEPYSARVNIKRTVVDPSTNRFVTIRITTNALYNLASTSKHLRNTVEGYCGFLLKKNQGKKYKNRKNAVLRKKWLNYLNHNCQLCGRNTVRRAILVPDMACCASCDRKHYPKITMTEAQTKYKMSKFDLFTPNPMHSSLPPLTTGVYTVMGGTTTMILESDVLARKDYIHSYLDFGGGPDVRLMMGRKSRHDRAIKTCNIQFKDRKFAGLFGCEAHVDDIIPEGKFKDEQGMEFLQELLDWEWTAMRDAGLRT